MAPGTSNRAPGCFASPGLLLCALETPASAGSLIAHGLYIPWAHLGRHPELKPHLGAVWVDKTCSTAMYTSFLVSTSPSELIKDKCVCPAAYTPYFDLASPQLWPPMSQTLGRMKVLVDPCRRTKRYANGAHVFLGKICQVLSCDLLHLEC